MITWSGECVYPSHGVPRLESVGVGLGRMPRFAGQTRDWYPVLAHTLVVASLVPEHARIYALLHDAPEAIVADVPTPWKTDAARRHEEILLERLYGSLDLPNPTRLQADAVKAADQRALVAEAHTIGHPTAWLFGEPDSEAATATQFELDHCREYLDPDTAAATFVTAVTLTMAARGGTNPTDFSSRAEAI